MLHEPEQSERLRTEVDLFMAGVQDDIMGKLTMDAIKNLSFVKMAYMEVLRRDTPAAISSTSTTTETTTIGGIEIRPGDAFWIDMKSICNDPAQWKEPARFIPDRFDPDSVWYLTPGGEKRATFAWVPFFGGHRMCLGMRLAELALKT
mmetsp:Transcript_17521/g.22204  ORF Transcript_17521/g.22204 Transcript_17521/m.22204 type:complete len:148 (+) Transcript_17521:959-1402(+)